MDRLSWTGGFPFGKPSRQRVGITGKTPTGREVRMAFLSPPQITSMDQARAHRKWALAILFIVYIFNFIDRQIVNILQEDIKHDLSLNDAQLGTMTGLAFAFVYCTMGI